jgi:hypothetical protein
MVVPDLRSAKGNRSRVLRPPSGRGLYLLRRLADRYGVDDVNDGGKVWFEIDLGPTTRSG